MNRTIRRILMIGVVPLAGFVLAACSSTDTGMNHGSTTSSNPMMGGDHQTADVEFSQMMIVHHQQAVDMAVLAETRATDPEIKTIAGKIKAAQQPEITTMTGWLTAWGQPTAQPSGHAMSGMGAMPGLMSAEEMKQLEAATGTDFDRMFARAMIAHHNGAIQMAKAVQTNGSNADVKALAAAIITAQTSEVDQLQKILDRL